MNNLTIGLLFILLFNACSPKIRSNIAAQQSPLSDTDEVLVLQKQDYFNNDGINIGVIKSGDNGLSVNCSYEDVIANVKRLARKNGANVVKIITYKDPDRQSTCVRLTAQIYRVPDVRKHEVIIDWSANRKLNWNDFKGTPVYEPNSKIAAETYAAIIYKETKLTIIGHGTIKVSAIFNCDSSWVKTDQKTQIDLLEHEQDHFDLCEVYARLLRKKIKENKIYANDVNDLDEIIYAFTGMYLKRQNLYDEQTEHGLNKKNQTAWTKEINEELNKLNEFAQ